MCRLRKCLLLLDGGTTNTRFTLVENNQILAQSQCRTGAVDAAREGIGSAPESGMPCRTDGIAPSGKYTLQG